ncbi:LysR family transcriptional regulator [Caulobacter mirabilis]|uniref:LysR family transcriptional regulator n=1 Tax=Caulobacter mirabilis TaxID=69666 RepID=A0A2D2AT24_9CAUL|nr:LysR family transcriptional regulator [Caulobacter mirabilis]ATQ41162.1 LysR family transcriptional regulator [Caulobacter mirabilis]
MLDLNRTHAFVAVARQGGFAAAGRTLGLPRSTISARVLALEAALGVRLLRRSTRRVVLTDEGRAYLEAVEGAIDALVAAEEGATTGGGFRGVIRMTVPVETPLAPVSAAIVAFNAEHPRVVFDMRVTNRRLDLIAENIDLAIRGGDPGSAGLAASRLPDVPFGLFASPSYLAGRGTPHGLTDLLGHILLPLVGAERRRLVGLPPELERRLLAQSTAPAADSMTFLRHLALDGAGIVILPVPFCADDLAKGALRHLVPDWTGGADAANWLVFPSRRDISPRVRAFVEVLRRRLGG